MQDSVNRICYSAKMNWHDIKIFLTVARTRTLSEAGRSLHIDSSTVSRRLHQLEKNLGVSLFERGSEGHVLTQEGKQFLRNARKMENTLHNSLNTLEGKDLQEKGNVRIGCTEAFGSFFIANQLNRFQLAHPNISVDILPLSRQVNLSRYEADIAITVGKPTNTSMIVTKLCDYRLKIYASKKLLNAHSVESVKDLQNIPWVSYTEHMDFASQLAFIDEIAPNNDASLKSSSVIAQYMAVKSGLGVAVLPCFLVSQQDELVPLFSDTFDLVRSFYLMAQPDRKRIRRVELLWDYIKALTAENQQVLLP
ncbi:LysR family transcriptional regulator [Thalassotalea sp. Y01]|uniref:LysR family transcriptional regulator n=1 Tax=Thalassotalea sp. Y01 TaxID=2729613 RepID=UPI00145D2C4B|nr:LysR family transcriptional regulator [Thalassotalea sp. Y01]NMP15246.1 LysR family transcriptional regulator [Thalassotalea sp. Y01]